MKILLVEDNTDSQMLIQKALVEHEVLGASTLQEARQSIRANLFELIIIDIELPDGSGFDFCSELSRDDAYSTVPKLILSGHDKPQDKVYGFQCGAIDYLTKPFSIEELKIRVMVRGANRRQTAVTRIGSLEFDANFQKCYFLKGDEKEDLMLTPTEYRILFQLAENRGKVCSRSELIRGVWKSAGVHIEKRGIDTHISHIRKKFLPHGDMLHCRYGKGYFIREDALDQ